jgi:hypothetical protein
MKTYKDTISGEKLYVSKNHYGTFYYKDKTKKTYHRIDGPAAELGNGTLWWYRNNKAHRLDGPAIEWGDGSKIWCIDGVLVTNISESGEYEGPKWSQHELNELKGN